MNKKMHRKIDNKIEIDGKIDIEEKIDREEKRVKEKRGSITKKEKRKCRDSVRVVTDGSN